MAVTLRREFEKVFAEYDGLNPAGLSYEDCCKAIAHLQDSLVNVAHKKQKARLDFKGTLLNFEPDYFTHEMEILDRYAAQLAYSCQLFAWINSGREELNEFLWAEIYEHDILNRWAKCGSNQSRLDMLQHFAAVQVGIYAEGVFNPEEPELDLIKDRSTIEKGVLGSVDLNHKNLKQGLMPAIMMAPETLTPTPAGFKKGIAITHHEAIHWILAGLVRAYIHGEIDEAHMLHNDAKMQTAKSEYGAVIDSAIYSSYRKQPEEQLCFHQSDLLVQHLQF